MKGSFPLVSVIIPVFNSPYIRDAVCSVIDQTYRPLEVIVVDDGSSVKVSETLSRISGIRTIRADKNRGVSSARNTGLKACRGDLISFIDSDDIWMREKTEWQVEFLMGKTECDLVYGRFRNFLQKGIAVPPVFEKDRFFDPSAGTLISTGTMMVRRDPFFRCGLFDVNLRTGEDLDWFIRARENNLRTFFIDRLVMMRRLHDRNVSLTCQTNKGELLRLLRSSIERKRKRVIEK